MGDWIDIIVDNVTPQSAKDVQNIYKVGKAIDKIGSKPTPDSISDFQSILKKGWIENAEKKLKLEIKRMDIALAQKPTWPDEKIDALEKKVIANYRTERKKGLPQVKCKKAIAAVRPLLKEIARHQKALEDIAALCVKAQKIAAKWEADYRDKKAYAERLAKEFKFLSQVVLMTAPQAEMVTYYVHCMELKKLFAEAESCAKKLGKRAKAD